MSVLPLYAIGFRELWLFVMAEPKVMGKKRQICRETAREKVRVYLAMQAAPRSFELLQQVPVPDTFLGRKTHEPFPENKE